VTITDGPAAVLWDLDGTIVDSEPYWLAEETALIESFGGTWTPAEALNLVGSGLWVTAETMQRKGVPWHVDQIVDYLTDKVMASIRKHVPWRPGARELLAEMREAGIKTALVTMSIRRGAQLVADAIPFDAFDVIVSGNDVESPKPHPEAYLKAAELLGVDPADCVAIEDSPPGLASAIAAGALAIGVPHVLPLPEGPTHVLWQTLAGKTVADLRALYATRNGNHIEAAQ
jgi:HAD superfamily hydrolase (TIGR01509 family)